MARESLQTVIHLVGDRSVMRGDAVGVRDVRFHGYTVTIHTDITCMYIYILHVYTGSVYLSPCFLCRMSTLVTCTHIPCCLSECAAGYV